MPRGRFFAIVLLPLLATLLAAQAPALPPKKPAALAQKQKTATAAQPKAVAPTAQPKKPEAKKLESK